MFEVWDSRADQEQFMAERLGPALRAAGVSSSLARYEWRDLAAYWSSSA